MRTEIKVHPKTGLKPKRAYHPPTLTLFGKLAEITAGGTGIKQENVPGPPGQEKRFS